MCANWLRHPAGAQPVGILAMVTPLKTWQGPLNISSETTRGKTSQKSLFVSEQGQTIQSDPSGLAKQEHQEIGYGPNTDIGCKVPQSDWVRHDRKSHDFQERPGFSQVQGTNTHTHTTKPNFEFFPQMDRQGKKKKEKKKGKMLTSFHQAGSGEWFLWLCSEPQLVSFSRSRKRRRGTDSLKITFPGFMVDWKEALD